MAGAKEASFKKCQATIGFLKNMQGCQIHMKIEWCRIAWGDSVLGIDLSGSVANPLLQASAEVAASAS